MSYLDVGKDRDDIYTPTRQELRMVCKIFLEVSDYVLYYKTIKSKPEKNGSLIIDKIVILQDLVVKFSISESADPQNIKAMWTEFDQGNVLPHPNLMRDWSKTQYVRFWQCVKAIQAALLMVYMKNEWYPVRWLNRRRECMSELRYA